MPWITMQELIALTTISECADCGLRHAPVRTCEETKHVAEILGTKENES